MTQQAIAISTTPPLPGLQMVQQANGALATIASDFAGSTDPASLAGAYMTWADTSTGLLKRRNDANTAWVVVGQIFPASAGYMLVTEEKGVGVSAGASVAGTFSVRALNTIRANTITGASLASSQLTLPAGTYRISASSPANGVNLHTARFYNVSDSASAIFGTSENTSSASASPGETSVTRSFVQGRLVLASPKVFELRHYCQETVAAGLGSPVSVSTTEVYATVEIIKES
jgi:hypothetical protein